MCSIAIGLPKMVEAGLVGSTFNYARNFNGGTPEEATNILVRDGGAPEIVSGGTTDLGNVFTNYTFDVRETSIVMNAVDGGNFSPFAEHVIEFSDLNAVNRPQAKIVGATYQLITPEVRHFGQNHISVTDDSLTLDVTGTVNEFGQVFNASFGAGSSFLIDLEFEGLFDPSNASFDNDSDIDQLTLDFGTVEVGSGPATLPFSITNLSGPGPLAPLSFLSAFFSGGNTAFSTNLTGFPDLDEGGTQNFLATLSTGAVGTYSSRFNIFLNDETDSSTQFLRLTLNGNVEESAVPEPSSFALLAMSLICLAGPMLWRK
ncbi:hypothetical protein Mal48_25580 [Thalassoglobus polymorphus]|uniref:Ice-binding protein C-terminal domain-containing protein n=2 Tax=Thalassoglobus polymorphus TaxID=2527994 RepID=A0A517QNW2_9PLAN|nr:hypothetical protein Mal48_25580 [Thalassoglobus polymorphus]